MHCTNCGAPVNAESMSRGACRYCDAAIVKEDAPAQPGVAEILQAFGMAGASGATTVAETTTVVQSSSSYVVDGKTYARLEDMPPDVRKRVEEKLAKLAALGLGPQKR